ncbi:histidine kinase [Cellulosimicrobium sp. XJ-DQ-B-000]|uniref:sensor histidine kinase n=1 Tax=Cellulosimicrobium sp. XJ-DQ-B-000 TaxID=3072182 RepID=UPI0028075A61|nr:histidine kinase [Cellulosimicrobium sp. XJ-DQ-B-000]MDQ8042228.1 histidine kinase [Cellulosimicrobium sp. XJ-DQ-B-000]
MGVLTRGGWRAEAAVGVATAMLGVTLVVLRADADVLGRPVEVEAAAQVVGAVLLVALGRWPLGAYVACTVLSAFSPVVATAVCAYLVGRDLAPTRAVTTTVLGAQAGAVVVWVVSAPPWEASHLVAVVAVTLLAWLLGGAARTTADAARARQDAEIVRETQLADAVRRGERDRLAREMHDVVAHRISLIVLSANRIEAGSAPDPGAVAAQIRQTGRAALDDMREVLGRLRHDVAAPDLAHLSLPEIDGLVTEMRQVGQPVDARVTAAHREPPDVAERTAVLVVREALTNAVRHAPGARTTVDVADEPATLRVRVANARPARIPEQPLTTGGHGLDGLRERVDLLAGRWSAGPAPDGGFAVEAVIPRAEP